MSRVFELLQYASKGNLTELRRLHQQGVDMSGADYDIRRALHLAAADGHLQCVRFLLEDCGVAHSPRDRWNNTPLDEAKREKREAVVKYLSDYIRKTEEAENGENIFMMLNAAANGDLPSLKSLYQEGIDMTKADYDNRTALHLAASEGQMECCRFLIETCKVPVLPRDRWYHTPMDEAKRIKRDDLVAYLEKQQQAYRRSTAGSEIYSLLSMANRGDLPGINKMLHSGVDMNMSDYDNRTAMHLAAAEGKLDCVKFLYERCGANINPQDRWGNSPLDEARRFKRDAVIKYLEGKLAVPKSK